MSDRDETPRNDPEKLELPMDSDKDDENEEAEEKKRLSSRQSSRASRLLEEIRQSRVGSFNSQILKFDEQANEFEESNENKNDFDNFDLKSEKGRKASQDHEYKQSRASSEAELKSSRSDSADQKEKEERSQEDSQEKPPSRAESKVIFILS